MTVNTDWLEDVDLRSDVLRFYPEIMSDDVARRVKPWEFDGDEDAEGVFLGDRGDETELTFARWDKVLAYRLQHGHGSRKKLSRWLWKSGETIRKYTRAAELIPSVLRVREIPLDVYYDVVSIELAEIEARRRWLAYEGVAQGLSTAQIADNLGVTPYVAQKTVERAQADKAGGILRYGDVGKGLLALSRVVMAGGNGLDAMLAVNGAAGKATWVTDRELQIDPGDEDGAQQALAYLDEKLAQGESLLLIVRVQKMEETDGT